MEESRPLRLHRWVVGNWCLAVSANELIAHHLVSEGRVLSKGEWTKQAYFAKVRFTEAVGTFVFPICISLCSIKSGLSRRWREALRYFSRCT